MHLKVPPPIVLGICLVLTYFGGRAFPALSVSFPGQSLLAVILLIAGLAMGGHALFCFFRAKTTFNPLRPDKAQSLVTDGLYRITRNPMYLADLLLLFAYAAYSGTLTVVVVAPLFVWYLNEFQIKPEEDQLTRIFGKEYLDYRSRVRRWI